MVFARQVSFICFFIPITDLNAEFQFKNETGGRKANQMGRIGTGLAPMKQLLCANVDKEAASVK